MTFPLNDDIFAYTYSIFEEKFHAFNPASTDDLEDREAFLMYFKDAESFTYFLTDEAFRELDDGYLKQSLVNTVLYNEEHLVEIQEYIRMALEEEKDKTERGKIESVESKIERDKIETAITPSSTELLKFKDAEGVTRIVMTVKEWLDADDLGTEIKLVAYDSEGSAYNYYADWDDLQGSLVPVSCM